VPLDVKFNGGSNYAEFKRTFNYTAKVNGWNDSASVSYIGRALKSMPEVTYLRLLEAHGQALTMAMVWAVLDDNYGHQLTSANNALVNCRHQLNQSVEDYCIQFGSLVIPCSLAEGEVVRAFYSNLRSGPGKTAAFALMQAFPNVSLQRLMQTVREAPAENDNHHAFAVDTAGLPMYHVPVQTQTSPSPMGMAQLTQAMRV
jgi:hypothetical protein